MMDIDHILTEMISDETVFNKVHLGQEVRRRIAVKDAEIERLKSFCLDASDKEIMDKMGERIVFQEQEIERLRALVERAKLLLEPVRIAGNTFTKNICDENGKLVDSNVIWLKDAGERGE